METSKRLPIEVTKSQRENPYIMSGLAQRAFSLAGYDMTPDDMVNEAIRLRLIIESPKTGTITPTKIKRMPGNGSFA